MMNEDVHKTDQVYQDKSITAHKHVKLSRRVFVVMLLFAAVLSGVLIIAFNNCSLWSDKKFSDNLDKAIEKATGWVHDNEAEILKVKNVALIKMLQDCNALYPAGNFAVICDKFMEAPMRPACWKALIDPNFPVQKSELDIVIKKELLDNKWFLYAIAPDKADVSPEQMELLSPDKWDRWQMTHQLLVLTYLRKTRPQANNEGLIEHLCDRINRELAFNLAVVHYYIQKIAFVMYSGHPEKIRRRWVERVINNQRTDGGWNDRWFCFESINHRRRPVFSINQPPSDQETTVQALWLLCQVKYRYPKSFGID